MSSTHVEALEILVRARDGARDPELKTALVRLSGEIHTRLVRGSNSSIDFIEASVRALSRVRGSAHARLRMACLCDSGQYLFSNGRSAEAVAAGAYCEVLARRVGNQDWLSKAQTLQAMANAELGNIAQAVIQCSSALGIAQNTGNLIREVSVLINLGIALNYGGLYREAIPCFDRVIALMHSPVGMQESAKLGPLGPEFELSALTNKAQSHYDLDQVEDGFAAIDLCLKQCAEPWDATSCERRATREFTFVQLSLELGKLAAARQHAQLCYRYGHGANHRGHLHAKIALALCDVHGGDAERGLAELERLLPDTKATAHRITVLSALIRSYDEMSRPELALERMRELLSHIRAQRELGIAALLSIGSSPSVRTSRDLDAFTMREALLRAKVAERKVVTERIEMFERFAVAADLKEDESGKHGYRVARLSALMAEELGWSSDAISALEMASRLHDIGKIAMPDRILLSSQRLKEAERHFMSMHTIVGSELLSKSKLPQLRMAEEIARYHHECWDGTGYPARLSGKRIPIHARIVALADVFDALTHGRPYAAAWTTEDAIEEIRERRGQQFDPELTDVFIVLMKALSRSHPQLDEFLAHAGRNSPFLQARDKIRHLLDTHSQAEIQASAGAEIVH